MRPRAFLALALVAALAFGVPVAAAAPAEPTAPAVAKKAKKKRKAVKCKKTQVPVKVNRRIVGCRALGAALPPPKEGDARLLLAKSLLDDDLGGLRDRRGRKAASLKKVLRKAGPRAYSALQRAIPEGVARLDQMAVAAKLSPFARPLPKCGASPPPTKTDTYTSSSGGQTVTATVTLGAVGTLDLQLEGGAYKISVSVTADECSHFDAPECPTAQGVVEATDSSTFKASVSVAKGDTVLMSRSADFSGRTRMRAEVGEDAKLEHIDVDDTQTANIDLGGAKQEFGPVNLLYTGIHHARVKMPRGDYVPDQSAVDIALTLRGVTVGKSDLGAAGNNIAADLDKSFAALVDREIASFRSLERAWGEAPYPCVEVRFSPRASTLTLRRGDNGSVSGQAVAKQGGGAARGRWTLSGQQNATFTPERAEGAEPRFSYDVTNAGFNAKVTVTVRVTSKAGVREETWTQDTKSDEEPLYYGELSATVREFPTDPASCPEHAEWSYSASLQGFEGAPFTIGADGGAFAINESGGGQYEYPPCNGSPGCSTGLSRDPGSPDGSVTAFVEGDTVEVNVTSFHYAGPNRACGFGMNGLLSVARFPLSMVGAPTITVDLAYRNDGGHLTHVTEGTLTMHRVK